MFKKIFILVGVLILPLISVASELADQINHDLNLPSGISVSPDNTVVYDSNYYTVKSIKGGHVFSSTRSASDSLITEENEGRIVRIASISQNNIQVAALGNESLKSSTKCGVTVYKYYWTDAVHCTTVNKQLCQQLLNSINAKDVNEAENSIKKCKDIANTFNDKKFKDAVHSVVNIQKENFASIGSLVKTSNGSIPELTGERLKKLAEVDVSDTSKHFTDLLDVLSQCRSSKFDDDGVTSVTPLKYKPATAVK